MHYTEIEQYFQDADFKSSLLMHYSWQQIRRSSKAKLEMQTLIKMKETWKRLYPAAAAAHDNDDDDIVSAFLWTGKYSYSLRRIIIALFNMQQRYKPQYSLFTEFVSSDFHCSYLINVTKI